MRITWVALKQGRKIRILQKLKDEAEKVPKNSKKSYLPYPKVWKRICGALCLRKEEARQELCLLEELELIENVPYHGYKLNFEILEVESNQ